MLNALLYHLPLFAFVAGHLAVSSFMGGLTLATLLMALLASTVLPLTALALISSRLLKPCCMLMALCSSIALYFVLTYHAVLDETMMGNVWNTNLSESLEFLHPTLFLYLLVLGVLPCLVLARVHIRQQSRLRLAVVALVSSSVVIAWGLAASSTWLWFDKNSKVIGGLAMPWSYLINMGRYELPTLMASDKQVPLPPATFASNTKTVVMLVIGEAARAANFQLYGYSRPTNPLLSKAGVVALRNARSCATYTTASLRCILAPVDPASPFSKHYEPLPSYLERNGVDVVWRTRNWGEPPLKVQTYQRAGDLSAQCTGEGCSYDQVLLSGLGQRIKSSPSDRIFIVLHQSGSHGPAYYTKYPPGFEYFKPVCKSVQLGNCSHQELVNAYDNTIVYEDYFLARAIELLKQLPGTAALLIYLSDHGESLGEHGMYLHGLPYTIAPEVQKRIPFIVWMSDAFIREKAVQVSRLESQSAHSQQDVFHTVMGAFCMQSAAYRPDYDIFSQTFAAK